MKLTIIHNVKSKNLLITPETIAEAFALGELWGEWCEKINVGLGNEGALQFDLLQRKPEDANDKPSLAA